MHLPNSKKTIGVVMFNTRSLIAELSEEILTSNPYRTICADVQNQTSGNLLAEICRNDISMAQDILSPPHMRTQGHLFLENCC